MHAPEIRARFPGLPPPPARDADSARFRFFDGMATFLGRAARARPIVLVLDDLQGADQPSLLLLRFLARGLRERPTRAPSELRRDHHAERARVAR